MTRRMDPELEHEMEAAIAFLSQRIRESGHNPKPVVLHSIRVGLLLFNAGASRDEVIAGLLHDVVEDSDTSNKDVAQVFGANVSQLVAVASEDASLSWKDRYEAKHATAVQEGPSALRIIAADFLDNHHYYVKASSQEQFEALIAKSAHFIELARPSLGQDDLFRVLERSHETLTRMNWESDGSEA